MTDLINRLIDTRVDDGDLNNCNLTFQELQTVKEIFGQVLQGVHHPRVNYPTASTEDTQSADAVKVSNQANAQQGQLANAGAVPSTAPILMATPADSSLVSQMVLPPEEPELRHRETIQRIPGGVEQPV